MQDAVNSPSGTSFTPAILELLFGGGKHPIIDVAIAVTKANTIILFNQIENRKSAESKKYLNSSPAKKNFNLIFK
ncbi:MAG: hypothetical protein AAFW70_29300 [Cyanobacteria bacterium J06635_10]